MNPIRQVFTALDEAELVRLVQEVQAIEAGAATGDAIRALSARLHDKFSLSSNEARTIVTANVVREAARRWAQAVAAGQAVA